MALDFFRAHKGLDIRGLNIDASLETHNSGADLYSSADVENSGADSRNIGALAQVNDGTGKLFIKKANAGANADWDELTNKAYVDSLVAGLASGTTWRPQKVIAATGTPIATYIHSTNGNWIGDGVDITPGIETNFVDDDGADLALSNGDYVIFGLDDAGGAELYVVSNVCEQTATSTTNYLTGGGALDGDDEPIVFTALGGTDDIVNGYTFNVFNMLPDDAFPNNDNAEAERQAIVVITNVATGAYVIVSDVNFGIADGIGFDVSSPDAYDAATGQSGTVIAPSTHTVQDAVEILDGRAYNTADTLFGAHTATELARTSFKTWTTEAGSDFYADLADAETLFGNIGGEIGLWSGLTGLTRTGTSTTLSASSDSIWATFDKVDSVIGADSEMSGTLNNISTSNSIYANLKALDLALASSVTVNESLNFINTTITLDSFDYTISSVAKWFVVVEEDDESRRATFEVYATHNGKPRAGTPVPPTAADWTITHVLDMDDTLMDDINVSIVIAGDLLQLQIDTTSVPGNTYNANSTRLTAFVPSA